MVLNSIHFMQLNVCSSSLPSTASKVLLLGQSDISGHPNLCWMFGSEQPHETDADVSCFANWSTHWSEAWDTAGKLLKGNAVTNRLRKI
jgi:hypothetical protein